MKSNSLRNSRPSGSLLRAMLCHGRGPAYAEACRCRRRGRRMWRQDSWSSSLISPSSIENMAMPAVQELGIWLIIYYFCLNIYIGIQRVPVKPDPAGTAARAQKVKKPSRTAKLLLLPKYEWALKYPDKEVSFYIPQCINSDKKKTNNVVLIL